ncbi:alpha/beta hydrolase family protein [Polymorphobacter fuscus]|uniref:Dienelactone hydrolase n=1 Tax=Sandarakinorhabdus fusca TaxID=1439888 RepID=A0A7C9KYE7_9SPHN|nr:dienelactone hydrolase [Polymorphobacter fuscus]KAB7647597.1 dienelactone hydrolase [Polymorphobacter fuscus]MQT16868.1 dienelactone hydrolase [Polymorphobacter fuscus]NJC09143.1 putative dienelactone hydrolase [Polymorphobacter fuscus]
MILALVLAVSAATPSPITCTAVWRDAARNRDVPVRITLPAGKAQAPVVLWSPGLGGDVGGGGVWAAAWARAGLAVVQMQHPGSDGAVYRAGGTPEERRARVAAGTRPDQLLARVGDTGFVLTELGRRRREGACDLARIDTDRAAIAGHSMGAWVAQAVAGQRFGGRATLVDRRFRAAVAFSPTGDPRASAGPPAFVGVGIPFLSITGTFDGAPQSADPAQQVAALAARSAPYQSMPADGSKCLLVLGDATHMMFSGNTLTAAAAMTARHVQDVSSRAATSFLVTALAGKRPDLTETVTPLLVPGDSLGCK